MKKLLLLCSLLYSVSIMANTTLMTCPDPNHLKFVGDHYYGNYVYPTPDGEWDFKYGTRGRLEDLVFYGVIGVSKTQDSRSQRLFNGLYPNLYCEYTGFRNDQGVRTFARIGLATPTTSKIYLALDPTLWGNISVFDGKPIYSSCNSNSINGCVLKVVN
jgi:hypothetical protein